MVKGRVREARISIQETIRRPHSTQIRHTRTETERAEEIKMVTALPAMVEVVTIQTMEVVEKQQVPIKLALPQPAVQLSAKQR